MSGSTLRAPRSERFAYQLIPWVGWATIAWLLLLSLALAARRITGGLAQAPDTTLLLITAVGLAALAAAGRTMWFAAPGRMLDVRIWLVAVLPAASVVLVGVALSMPGASLFGMWGFWLIVGLEEATWVAVWWNRHRRRDQLADGLPAATAQLGPSAPPLAEAPDEFDEMEEPAAIDDVPENALQYLVRTRGENGLQRIEGTLRAEFARGERFRHVHVAFCPPLEKAPEVEVYQLDGPEASVKTGELRSYGLRLDVRLARAAKAAEAMQLHFTAEEPAE